MNLDIQKTNLSSLPHKLLIALTWVG